ncbi:hypothetical protein L7F22_033351 [Adiantum nelumboides]|nr:hypothetical protein [Adiantum nelumboides]
MRCTRDPCTALRAFVLGNEVAQQGFEGPMPLVLDEGLSKLQKLCCKLQSIVAGQAGATRTASKIYAGNAMVALLCDAGRKEMGQEVKGCLADIVIIRIKFADAEPRRAGAYFSAADVEVVKRLRSRVGVPQYERWRKVRIVDQTNGTVLSDPRDRRHSVYDRAAVDKIIE